MRVYSTRRAPNPRGLRSDLILWWVGSMALTYIVLATIWTLLALLLTPGTATLLLLAVCAAGVVALVVRARQLDRRDAAASRNATAIEEDPDGNTAPGQES